MAAFPAASGPALRTRDPLVLLLYSATLLAALATLGRTIVPALDEGVYLTAARLMVHDGLLPFRDFSLVHPPFTVALAGLVLEAVGGRMVLFDALYTAWCLCAVFPLARTVRALTGDRRAALVAALLFLTFPEFLRWDARFFGLRQASLPFLAFALEALWVRRKPAVAGVLLGLFGAGLVPHAFLAVILGGASTLMLARDGEVRAGRRFAVALVATLTLIYGATVLIPGFWASAFGFQVSRERVPALDRFARVAFEVLPESGPILLAGLAGSFLLPARARAVAWLHLVGLPVVLLAPPSFYPHYLSSFGLSLALAAGALVARLGARGHAGGRAVAAGTVGAAILASGLALKEPLSRTTPHLFRVVAALRQVPGPLLCLEPVYAHWAGREMTFHYHVTDLRYASRTNVEVLDDGSFFDVVSRSRSVLVDANLEPFLTPDRRALLQREFAVAYRDPRNVVLTRRRAPMAPAPRPSAAGPGRESRPNRGGER